MENEPEHDEVGEPEARPPLRELFVAVYDELRRLARRMKLHDAGFTLNPTALVHEVWLRLFDSPGFEATSVLEFKQIAASAMRQVLVDAARRRGSLKRGGKVRFVTLDDSVEQGAAREEDVLALNEALEALSLHAPRQVRVVELRYFAGLSVAETAAALGVSEETVKRDWKAAKAWLKVQLRQAG